MPWTASSRRILEQLQQCRLLQQLLTFAQRRGLHIFVVGGTIRDVCLGRQTQDLDVTLAGDVMAIARDFARETGGAYVPLDPTRGEARVVYRRATIIDFARMRGSDITHDLGERDFTINALASPLDSLMQQATPELFDPYAGLRDLEARVIRMVSPESFRADPLRMLRAFRLAATLEGTIEETTLARLKPMLPRMSQVAAERVHVELIKLFGCQRSAPYGQLMARVGLLDILFPELAATHGIAQDRTPHPDVFEHSLLTYRCTEAVIGDPARFFAAHADAVGEYVLTGERPALLKWAALLHDIGKPGTRHVDDRGRVSFDEHARRGAQLWEQAGRRLKLSVARITYIRTLVGQHRRPFELLAADTAGQLTGGVVYRLFKELGDDVLGLFVLAVADACAGRDPRAPPGRAAALGGLCGRLWDCYRSRVRPVLAGPRLLTGDDLQRVFGLTPGPRFKTLLEDLDVAQVEGQVQTREEAIRWVEPQLRRSPT